VFPAVFPYGGVFIFLTIPCLAEESNSTTYMYYLELSRPQFFEANIPTAHI
jgi:hypothetical protein